MSVKPSRTIVERVSVLRSSSFDFAEVLDEVTDKVSDTFPHVSEDRLYILVVLPGPVGGWTFPSCMWTMLMLPPRSCHLRRIILDIFHDVTPHHHQCQLVHAATIVETHIKHPYIRRFIPPLVMPPPTSILLTAYDLYR